MGEESQTSVFVQLACFLFFLICFCFFICKKTSSSSFCFLFFLFISFFLSLFLFLFCFFVLFFFFCFFCFFFCFYGILDLVHDVFCMTMDLFRSSSNGMKVPSPSYYDVTNFDLKVTTAWPWIGGHGLGSPWPKIHGLP